MRRAISIFLVFAALLTLFGCADQKGGGDIMENSNYSAFTEIPRTYNEGDGETWTLANTYNCLNTKKQFNVAYIGGSVTVGSGSSKGNSWRELTTSWLKSSYPQATVNEIYAAFGGTGSMWGLFRLEEDVLAYNPDLVFIEFCINDGYEFFSETESAAFADAMIRKINEHNAETDIVLVFTTDEGYVGKDFANKRGYRKVAEYYGVPYIDVGDALAKEMQQKVNRWRYSVRDWAHPNDNGYRVYYNEVERCLEQWLSNAKAQTPKPHKLNETPAVTNSLQVVKRLEPSELNYDENWRLDDTPKMSIGNASILEARKLGAKITLEFEGTQIGYIYYGKENSKIKVTIDGSNEKVIDGKKGMKTLSEKIMYDNLSKGKHTLVIEYIGPGYFSLGALFIG